MSAETSAEYSAKSQSCCSHIPVAFANLFLRWWIGLRFLMAGVAKFREGSVWGKATFNMDNYNTNTDRIGKLMAENSILPPAMCYAYAHSIGFILLAVGLWMFVGLFTNVGLIVAGFTALSLGFGLASLPDDTEVVYIGIHILVIAGALATSRANKLSLDGLFFSRKSND